MLNFNYPSGLIIPFRDACPSDWTRYSALDNRFPRGVAAGTNPSNGGAETHSHTFDPPNKTASEAINPYTSGHAGQETCCNLLNKHTHPQYWGGVTSGTGNNLPPYIRVVYCKKD